MPNVGLRTYLWQRKTFEQRSERQLWSGNGGGTYEGYRSYIMQVKEQGFPAEAPAPPAAGHVGQPGELAQQQAGQQHHPSEQEIEAVAAEIPTSPTGSEPSDAAAYSPRRHSEDVSPRAAAWVDQTSTHTRYSDYHLLHTFHVTQQTVSLVKFARGSAELLAFGGHDGAVYLASAAAPPRLLQVMERHTGRLTGLDFSHDNTFLLSCSDDGTVCLWLVETGALVRVFRNAGGAVLSCRFHPVNPSLLFLGTAFGEVLVLNSSTGRTVSKVMLRPTHMAGVGAACLELAPNLLLVADTCSTVHLYTCSLHEGVLAPMQLQSRSSSPHGEAHEVSCLEFLPHSELARGPAVLLVDSVSQISVFQLKERKGKYWLEARVTARRPQASTKVRASLCPTASTDHPEALLMGDEDGLVRVLDLSRLTKGRQPAVVSHLAGHSAPVADVAWAYDESRLASCDCSGAVILWHKVQPAAVFLSDSFEEGADDAD